MFTAGTLSRGAGRGAARGAAAAPRACKNIFRNQKLAQGGQAARPSHTMVNWFQPPLQKKVEYRAGDTLIAVSAKSGTTWTMNIFHQLKTGGDADFKDIYAEVAWAEFKERPDQPDEELLERWAKLPKDIPRAFKTHSQPGNGPGDFATYREDLKYVVVVRNPEESIVSFFPFFAAHNPKLWELWGASEQRDKCVLPTFERFYKELVLPGFPNMPPEAVPP